jgi:DNA-binding SARP family transcriptional activator
MNMILPVRGAAVFARTGESATQPVLGAKCYSVLALLAGAGPRGMRREKIASLVWPDRDDAQSKSNLRQALTALRKALAPLDGLEIQTAGDLVMLTCRDAAVDLRAFEASGDAIQRGDIGLEEALGLADLYAGEFMSGFSFDGQLHAHMLTIRQRQHERALRLVERLSLEPEGHDAAEALAQRLIAADPSAEEAHRALIRIALMQGKKSRALKLLAALRAVVEEEFDSEPDPETLALFDAAPVHPGAPVTEADAHAAVSAPVRATPPSRRRNERSPRGRRRPALQRDNFTEPHTAAGRPSIAILPFAELGGPARGLLRRWPDHRDHLGPVADARFLRDRPPVRLCLQGPHHRRARGLP